MVWKLHFDRNLPPQLGKFLVYESCWSPQDLSKKTSSEEKEEEEILCKGLPILHWNPCHLGVLGTSLVATSVSSLICMCGNTYVSYPSLIACPIPSGILSWAGGQPTYQPYISIRYKYTRPPLPSRVLRLLA